MGRKLTPPTPLAVPQVTKGPSAAGPWEVQFEIIRRLLEREDPKSIRANMGLSVHEWDKIHRDPLFQREFELQAQVADRDIRSRLDRLAHESLDVVREIMRTSVNPSTKLRAAMEILDRSGYVKVEKRITLTADAESVIRELNRLGTTPDPGTAQATVPASDAQLDSEITDAEIVAIAESVAQEV